MVVWLELIELHYYIANLDAIVPVRLGSAFNQLLSPSGFTPLLTSPML